MPRMRILSAAERKRHLDFPRTVPGAARGMRSPANRTGFLLCYGCFRAARRFFAPEDCPSRDIAHVARATSPARKISKPPPARRPCACGISSRCSTVQLFDSKAEMRLVTEIVPMARAHLKPRTISGRCIDFLIEQRMQVPGTRRLTDLIRHQLADRKRVLMDVEVFGTLRDIRSLVDDARLSPVEKLDHIRIVLDKDRESAFRTLRADIGHDAADRDPCFQALEHRSRRLQNRIGPILRVVRFRSGDRCPDLMVAIAHFREKDGAVTASAPVTRMKGTPCCRKTGRSGPRSTRCSCSAMSPGRYRHSGRTGSTPPERPWAKPILKKEAAPCVLLGSTEEGEGCVTVKTSGLLTDSQDAYARSLVAQGRCSSLSTVLQRGPDLLQQDIECPDTEIAALRASVSARRTGDFVPLEEGLAAVGKKTAERRAAHGL